MTNRTWIIAALCCLVAPAASGCGSDSKTTAQEVCQSGATQCAQDVIQVCNESGEWIDDKDCKAQDQVCKVQGDAAVCVDAQSGGEDEKCEEGDVKCDANAQNVVRCNADGVFEVSEACDGEGEKCVLEADGAVCKVEQGGNPECTAGETRCVGDALNACTEEGKWKVTNCAESADEAKICEVRDDDVAQCVSECTEGRTRCSGDGTGVQTCLDGVYGEIVLCNIEKNEYCLNLNGEASCVNPNPEIRDCEEGETSCDGDVVRSCSEDGKWVAGVDCTQAEDDNKICEVRDKVAQCVSECTEGTTKCQGTDIWTCAGGAYDKTAMCDADTQVCKLEDGVAVCREMANPEPKPGICQNGVTMCNGDRIQTCTEGTWADVVNCADNEGDLKVCEIGAEGATCVSACSGDALRCNDDSIQKCVDGVWVAVEGGSCLESNQVCTYDDGIVKCVDKVEPSPIEPECAVGETRCDGTSILTCGADGKWTTGEDCASRETDEKQCMVTDGVAACSATCVEGYSYCKDGKVYLCNAEGVFGEAQTCAAGTHVCKDDGKGLAVCELKPVEPEKCEFGVSSCEYGEVRRFCNESGVFETESCAEKGELFTCAIDALGNAICRENACKEGTKRCTSNERYFDVCTNGEWKTGSCVNEGKNTRCTVYAGVVGCYEKDQTTQDSDGDTIPDTIEGSLINRDTDGDTIPDYLDWDSDGDTIPDSVEGAGDDDGDTIPNYLDLDSDNNGIPDMYEGCPMPEFVYTGENSPKKDKNNPAHRCDHPVDTDGDTVPDYLAQDNDGDGIPDIVEIRGQSLASHTDPNTFSGACVTGNAIGNAGKPIDCNGDTIPDYMSPDSDGDTIPDSIEGIVFKYGVYARYSLDTDQDGVPDSVEARPYDSNGDGKADKLTDSDNDTIPDIISLDSDSDGLPDAEEYKLNKDALCAKLDLRVTPDSDGDGYLDSAEYAVAQASGGKYTPAQMVCQKSVGVKDVYKFYFELPVNAKKEDTLTFVPKVSKLDVVFNVDTTGSMGGAMKSVRENVNSMVSSIKANVEDSGFSLAMFADFYIVGKSYGSSGDRCLRVAGPVTNDQSLIEQYMNYSYFQRADGGNDGPESGVEALYQIVTREGVRWKETASSAATNILSVIPAIPSGRWGAAGFRQNTLPVVIHVTDAVSHDKASTTWGTTSNDYYDSAYVLNAHYTDQLVPKLKSTGTRVISLNVGNADSGKQMTVWSRESNAVVPVCAFKTSATTWACEANKCCLGNDISSPESVNGKANQCILRYRGYQNAVANYITQGVAALVKYGTYDVVTKIRGNAIGNGKNTSCFIDRIEAKRYVAPPAEPEKSCNPTAVPSKIAISGSTPSYNNGFKDFATGTASSSQKGASLEFRVYAKNDGCYVPGIETKVFTAFIDVYNPTTGLLFDTQEVAIVVPGVPEKAND